MPTDPKPLLVAAAIIVEKDRYLITQRRSNVHCGDLWEFPGGKVLPGESLETCLVREIQEELGIEIRVLDLMEVVDHRYPDIWVSLNFFRCVRLSGTPLALGCSAFKWVLPEELALHPFPEADTLFLKKLGRSAVLQSVKPGG